MKEVDNVKRWLAFVMAIVVSIVLSACDVNHTENNSTPSQLEQQHTNCEIIPTGVQIDTKEMNNFLQGSGAFVQDDSFVYFDDSFYTYALDKENGEVEKTSRSSLENYKSFYYSAVIAKETVFSDTGAIWNTENPEKGWRICSSFSLEGSNVFTYSNASVLPQGDYIYYLYKPDITKDIMPMIVCGSIKDLQNTEETISVNNIPYHYLELPEAKILFQKDGLESFGIYGNYIVAITEDADIWVIDIETGENNMVVKGDSICTSGQTKFFSVDGDYIYFANEIEEKFERIHFDGTDRETVLEGMYGWFGDLFNCADGYLYHIDYSEEKDEYCLLRTDLNKPTSTIVLATGESEGVSPASYPRLYIIDDWVYYQSVSAGYWRSKADGSGAELILYAATSENAPDWNPDMVNRKSIATGYEHTVALKSDGTVIATGTNENGECNVSEWKDIISVYAGEYRTIGLKADGSVCVAGKLFTNESLSALSNTTSIDVAFGVIAGIKGDGQAVAVGTSSVGATKVSDWNNIVSISTSGSHTAGVKSDGTVIAIGDNRFGQCDVNDWTDIVDVATSNNQTVGLKSDGTIITTLKDDEGNAVEIDWVDIASIDIVGNDIFGIKTDGTVVTTGGWDVSEWTDIVDISCSSSHIVGLKADGTLVAEGSELYGMCDVDSWNDVQIPMN